MSVCPCRSPLHLFGPWLLVAAAVAAVTAVAAAAEPLVQQEPFDRITLVEAHGKSVLKVKPLALPNRTVPAAPAPTDKLNIQLLDEPDKTYEVQWSAIAKVELFEEMVLAEAQSLVTAGQLDAAYEAFRFLEGNHPRLPGLAQAVEDYLYEEAKASMRKKDFAGTLAMLREVHARNPKRLGLDAAMGAATESAVAQYMAREDFASARRLLKQLAGCFPGHPKALAGEEVLKTRAASLLAEAHGSDDPARATALCRLVEETWPATEGAKDLAAALHARWPTVAVGVVDDTSNEAPPFGSGSWYSNWAARRDGRLERRAMCEFVAPAVGGGTYRCSVGEILIEKATPTVTLKLGGEQAGPSRVAAWEVAHALASHAAGDLLPAIDLRRAILSAAPATETQVVVTLRAPFARPDALLAAVFRLQDGDSAEATPRCSVPYERAGDDAGPAVYRLRPDYFAARPTTPRQLTVRTFETSATALRALRAGKVAAVDRLSAAEAARLADDRRFAVRPYRVPLAHVLVPNLRRPLAADRDFRRAIVYGLHRQSILAALVGDQKAPDCRLLSGPFALGLGPDDPLRYACDPKIEPRPYEPLLAAALLAGFRGRADQAAIKLVLAHPPDDVAGAACREIAVQLGLLGVETELRELAVVPARVPEDVDLLYAEWAVCEPMVDALSLLGDGGPAGACSPAMGLALRRLADAATFAQAQSALHAVHRLAYEETSPLPLWQWVEYHAHRSDLEGVGDPAVGLYENIEQWKPAFTWQEQ